jgi:MFS family permease
MTQKILNRDFTLTFSCQLASAFVFYILIPTIPIYLSRSGTTEVENGILVGIFFVSSLVCRPLVGKALLKIPERTFMIIGAFLYAFASVAYLSAPPFWPFLIVRILHGIGFGLFQTASFTLIARVSPEIHRGQSFGYFFMSSNVPGAIAPSLGVFLINRFSFTLLFLVCSGLSLCSLLIAYRLGKTETTPSKGSFTDGGFLLSRKSIPPSIVASFSLFIWGALAAFFPLYAMHHGVTNPGLFFSTYAAMLVLVRSLGGRILDLYRKERIILPCLTSYILSMVILAFSKTQPMFILVAAILGIGHAFLIPALIADVLERDGSSPGPAVGTFMAISDSGISLGPLIMGIVIHLTNYPIMFLCLALAGIINLNYFYFVVRKRS